MIFMICVSLLCSSLSHMHLTYQSHLVTYGFVNGHGFSCFHALYTLLCLEYSSLAWGTSALFWDQTQISILFLLYLIPLSKVLSTSSFLVLYLVHIYIVLFVTLCCNYLFCIWLAWLYVSDLTDFVLIFANSRFIYLILVIFLVLSSKHFFLLGYGYFISFKLKVYINCKISHNYNKTDERKVCHWNACWVHCKSR